MMIGEFASSESGGSKAAWFTDALSKITTAYRRIRAIVYFEVSAAGMDWPIETSSSAQAAFAKGIANPAYATNSYGNLKGK